MNLTEIHSRIFRPPSTEHFVVSMIDGILADLLFIHKTLDQEMDELEAVLALQIEKDWDARINRALFRTIDKWTPGADGVFRPTNEDVRNVLVALEEEVAEFGIADRAPWLAAFREGWRTGFKSSVERVVKKAEADGEHPTEFFENIRRNLQERDQVDLLKAGVSTDAILRVREGSTAPVGAALLGTLGGMSEAEWAVLEAGVPEAMTDFTVWFANGQWPDRIAGETADWLEQSVLFPGADVGRGEFLNIRSSLRGRLKETRTWRATSATNLNRTVNFGMVEGYLHHSVTAYRIVATLDERTTDICVFMNDKTFPIEVAKTHVERFTSLAADALGADALLDEVPFRDVPNVEGLPISNLAALSMGLPPFHWVCRTVTEPTDFIISEAA